MSAWEEHRHWARAAAERIITTQQLAETPINPIKVAENLGVSVEFTTGLSADTASKLAQRSDQTVILVNRYHKRRRQRFAIAQAIGKYIHTSDDNDAADEEITEYAYSEFAAALLMPERWFRDDIKEGFSNAELAAMYDMSVASIAVRRDTLDI